MPPATGDDQLLGQLVHKFQCARAGRVSLRPRHGFPALPVGISNAPSQADWVADDRRHLLTTGMGDYTQNGVIGRPSLASAEKGKAVLASLVENFASVLEILQRAQP